MTMMRLRANRSSGGRVTRSAAALTVALALGACGDLTNESDAVKEQKASESFVAVDGSQFTLDGRPYRFVGANLWYGAYLGSDGQIGDRVRLGEELDLLKQLGVTNLRVLAASELSPLPNSIRPAFQNEAGEYNEELLRGLDFLLAEMAKRDMRAVLYLGNFWEWSGGFTTYLHWDESRELIELGNPEVEFWPAYAHLAAEFYASEKSMARYRRYLTMLLSRENSVTGRAYADDPTIMSWQLANEPRPGVEGARGEATVPEMSAWIADSASLIKSVAPDQLVSIGNEGMMGCINSEACYLSTGAIADVDYLTFHMWPKNWGWIDAADMQGTFPGVLEQAEDYVSVHVEFAQELGKPLVLEEFGLERDNGAVAKETSTKFRDRFLGHIFNLVERDAGNCGSFAGTNIWAWGGYGKAHRETAKWEAGDTSYLGDPPQEPQGLNSVFASDTSTTAVLARHAQRLSTANSDCEIAQ